MAMHLICLSRLPFLNIESPSSHKTADASSPGSPASTHSEQTSQSLLEDLYKEAGIVMPPFLRNKILGCPESFVPTNLYNLINVY